MRLSLAPSGYIALNALLVAIVTWLYVGTAFAAETSPAKGDQRWRIEKRSDRVTGKTTCLLSSPKGKRLSIVFQERGFALITGVDGTKIYGGRFLAQVDKNPPFISYAYSVEPLAALRVDRNDQLLAEMARGHALVIHLVHGHQSVEEMYRLPPGVAASYRSCLGL